MGKGIFHKSIIDHSPVGYSYNRIIYDNNGNPEDYEFIEVNQSYEALVGLQAKELIGKRFSQIYEETNKEQPDWNDFHGKFIDHDQDKEFDYHFDFIDKYYRVKSHSPQKGYLIIYLTDINREIRVTEKLKMLSDDVPTQVWYLNDTNTYASSNRAHADFVGFKKEDLVCKDINTLFGKEEAKLCIQGNEKVFNQKEEIITTSWLANHKKENRLLRITKTPKFNLKGDIDFVICSAEDITKQYVNKEESYIKERILYSSMDFTRELLANANHYDALAKGLEMLGNATQVDRVYYWENHYDDEAKKWLTSQKFEWCLGLIDQQIDNPHLQNIPFEEVGDFIGVLCQNKSFNAHTKDLSNKNSRTKEILQAQDILSILVIPVFVKKEFRGFIGFDSCNFEKEWSEVEVSLINSFVFLYIKAIERDALENNIRQTKENFFNFFNMIQDSLFVLDFEGNIVEINDNVLERLNYSREELLGKPVLMLHPEDQAKEVKKNIEDLISKKIEYCKIPALTRSGEVFSVETRVSEGLWNDEKVIFAVSKDISELSASEEKFSKAFNHSGVSMFISKFEDGQLLEVNDRFLGFTGYKRVEIIGKKILDLQIIVGDDKDRKAIKKEIEIHGKISDKQIKVLNKDNNVRTGLANIILLNINNEKCLLSSIVDITERIQYEEKILELSNRDSLTGVYNRHYIYERTKEIIEEYKRNKKLFSLSIIDVDNFKMINDKFGHQIGDCVLKEFTKIITENLRPYDLLGRYGGEEFIIILNHSNYEESYLVLERILNIVEDKVFVFKENRIKLTFSGGISSCEELEKGEITIDKLVEIADKRMYDAKNDGKNKIIFRF